MFLQRHALPDVERLLEITLMSIDLIEIPRSVDKEISAAILLYSVGIFRHIGADGNTFRLLGSGTLVQRGSRYGILTADHCIHRCNPPVRLGVPSNQRLYFVLRGSRTISASTDELFEHRLAPADPKRPSRGPDLTFIEIPPGERLSRFRAFSNFCPLDRDPEILLQEFAVPGRCFVCFGVPEVDQNITIRNDHLVFNEGKFQAFMGILKDIPRHRSKWDYTQIAADYVSSPTLPVSFAGVSGGGFWGIKIRRRGEVYDIEDYQFMGVAFYQTPVRKGRRYVRGHFVRSVYSTAWRMLPEV